MPGYIGTSSSQLNVALGVQSLVTQSALGFAAGQTVSIVDQNNSSVFMSGGVLVYNAVTGAMTVNITYVSGTYQLQAPFNTQVWGATSQSVVGWNISVIGGLSSSTINVAPTISVRALSSSWDPLWGSGVQNYLTDINAVAQIIAQTIKLLQNEWFAQTNTGTPLFQQILGVPQTTNGVALIMRQQILSCPYVTGISAFAVSYTSDSRGFRYSATVNTSFGQVSLSS